MYCTNCGEQIDSKAFCPHCGTRTAGQAAGIPQPVRQVVAPPPPAYTPAPAERVRQNLGRFRVFAQNVTCPNCGYFGPMGILSERTPFYGNCFVLALLILTMVGLVVVLLLAILGKLSRTHLVECPQCGAQFEISGK
ncbi:MAG TPA: hypothetical protein VHZ07_05380 [Bryobacteraceae bacterium]|jgi:predicted RNA-binding Zn-ribbon protein involved in translation (DUF1610 family)|nr:hypothetical protein [Bryobacteraceae bacterium]